MFCLTAKNCRSHLLTEVFSSNLYYPSQHSILGLSSLVSCPSLKPASEDFSSWPGLWEKQQIWIKKNHTAFQFWQPNLKKAKPCKTKGVRRSHQPTGSRWKKPVILPAEGSPHAMSSPFHHCCMIQLHFISETSLFTKRKGKKNMFCHLYAKPIVSFVKAIIFRY